MRKPEDIGCERDYKDFIEENMEAEGWDVIREVSPDHSNERADIIAKHNDIGWVGMECKYMTGGATVISDAIQQVEERYAGRQYLGTNIEAWGIAIYGRYYSADSPDKSEFDEEHWYHSHMGGRAARIAQAKRIVNGLGIGWVTTHSDRVFMEFCPDGKKHSIPLFGMSENLTRKYASATSLAAIEEKIGSDSPNISHDRGMQPTPISEFTED